MSEGVTPFIIIIYGKILGFLQTLREMARCVLS